MLRHGLLSLGMVLTAAPVVADPFENFGTAMKYALPAAAALCALRDDRAEDFAVRGALQVGLVLGLKHLFQNSDIGRRPSGGGDGFPSGHTASAMFGAADLAGKCFDDDPLAGAAAYGAAGMTGLSRLHAGEHTPAQVMSGALIGLSFGAASLGIGTDEVSISFGMRF
ncbi:MAG: phosphatase PAP2 family protein [Paracoccus sp. (in: a-proteobacteria)]|uniref:phosphatase PAP2 family protein n=1 Tax=Paracoccus sp. TaxID=267 RepID=UPI0026E0A773|nr:phosphatase PAP2 family protein [Paracoccus sp. (in: a-proteobacteria)]MDO5630965.1 phosphatase PAP2 family protein [Paracoccus sp. (in: a-proteobacteria)]